VKLAQTEARSLALNDENVAVSYPGVYLNFTGNNVLYPPTYHAALLTGLAAGLPPQVPLTHKLLSVQGFEINTTDGVLTLPQRSDLIDKGVLFSRNIEGIGFAVNKGINSIQGQNLRQLLETDNRSHEISIVRIKQQIQKELRINGAKVFPGTNRNRPSQSDVQSFMVSYLNSKVATKQNDNLLISWDPSSLEVTLDQDAWFVSWSGVPNTPINFIFFTNVFVTSAA